MKFNKINKNLLSAGIFAAALFLAGCTSEQKTTPSEDFAYKNISKITVDSDSWDFDISASDDGEVHISSDKIKEEKDIQLSLDGTELTICQNDSSSKGLSDQFSFGKSGKFTLSLPENTDISLNIHNGSGNMTVQNIQLSDFNVENDSGALTISNLTALSAEMFSDSGDIKLTDSSCTKTHMSTKSAYVTLKNSETREAAFSTESGEVGINNISGYNSLSIKTGSGDISLSHKNTPESLTYDVSSGSGDITLKLENLNPASDTEQKKQGIVGSGETSLSVISDSGTVVVK
ncbi:DUF4097 family beta strand repeat-containing protein [Lachnospiraceae bacterium 38-14]|jgi:hypothetical protein|uniref:DUF4097 family beta strand repeat-containing protein n=1 Tax=Roseburia sp. 1XD42-69 TaxID=2320088 RepID=UPI000EA074FE|nr:DUF4097 family beta strand repeat-containing protein [Roseburia sp. 1XD42-69]RKJ67156.1 hypothetical protein D7Y06_06245 [Roseburia sp. 1XD42-69]